MGAPPAGIHGVGIGIQGPVSGCRPPQDHLQPEVVVVAKIEGCLGHNLLSLNQIFDIISDALLKIKAVYGAIDLVIHDNGQTSSEKSFGLGLFLDSLGIENNIFEDVRIRPEHHRCATFSGGTKIFQFTLFLSSGKILLPFNPVTPGGDLHKFT